MGIIYNYFKKIFNKILDKFLSSKLYSFLSLFSKKNSKSLIFNYFFSNNGFAYKFKDSFICNKIISLINYFLNIIGFNKSRTIRDSYFKSLGSTFVYVLLCVFILLLFIVPEFIWNNYYIFVGIIFLIFIYCIFNNKSGINLKGLDSYIILYIILVIFSSLWSLNVLISLKYLVYLMSGIILLIMVINVVNNKERFFKLIYIISFGVFICSMYGIFQYIDITPNPLEIDMNSSSYLSGRISSFFGNANMFSVLLILFLPIQISMCLTEDNIRKKIFFGCVFVVAFIALLLTFSRGAWIAFIISMIVMVLMIKPKYVFVFILLFVVLIPCIPNVVKFRFLSIFSMDTSISLRILLYSTSINFISLNPLYGSGFGAINFQAMVYNLELFPINRPTFLHAHNLFLQIASESGLLTLLFFILFCVFMLIRLYKIGKSSKKVRFVCSGFLSCFVGLLVVSMFDYPWYFPRILIINWFFIGLLYVIINLYSDKGSVGVYEKK